MRATLTRAPLLMDFFKDADWKCPACRRGEMHCGHMRGKCSGNQTRLWLSKAFLPLFP